MPRSGQKPRKAVELEHSSKQTPGINGAAHLSYVELRQAAEKYARMIQSSPDAITLRSLPERRYIEVNEGFTKLTGYSSDEVLGKTSAELNLWVEQAPHKQTLNKLDQEGRVYQEEFRFRTKSGEIRHGQLSAVRMTLNDEPLMLSITHDITDLKRAEDALRRSEADFRSVVQGAPYGIYRVTKDGQLLNVNPALVHMLGYESETELLKCNMRDEIYRDPAARDRLIDEHGGNSNFRELETEWRRKDGKTITVILTGKRVENSESQLASFEVFAEDVTERRNLERQLLQSQKMDAIGRLAGGVAHDFNNLLAVILGHSEMLGEMEQSPRLQKSAEAIRKATERAAALTMQLLAFSRKQVIEPKVIDVNAAVLEMEKLVRRVISEDIGFTTKLEPELGRIKIDPGQFDQVLMNLVVNARDAMPKGGRLVLETKNVDLDEAYVSHHFGAKTGPYVLLAISDTGIGMDEAMLSRIFEPFFTTKEKGKGTGLGLSTVYGIVKQAGGHIIPYSEPKHGTTMKLYFPWAEQGAAVARASKPVQSIPRGTETILIVEDESALRELTCSILEEYGYTVIGAAGVQEALEIVSEASPPIDLLLTDVVMPGMGGRELANQLQELFRGLRVLFMSGYADDVIVHRGVLSKTTRLIQKPFTKRTLLTKVRESLDASVSQVDGEL
jgi:two-component system, cell cycle sensor histidine kinase and response regulator CckA